MTVTRHPGANERKRRLAQEWLSEGVRVLVTFNPFHNGTVVPRAVKDGPWPARMTVWRFQSVTDEGFSCLVSLEEDGPVDDVTIPWSAVFALTTDDWAEIHMWMADKELAEAHHALIQSPAARMRN